MIFILSIKQFMSWRGKGKRPDGRGVPHVPAYADPPRVDNKAFQMRLLQARLHDAAQDTPFETDELAPFDTLVANIKGVLQTKPLTLKLENTLTWYFQQQNERVENLQRLADALENPDTKAYVEGLFRKAKKSGLINWDLEPRLVSAKRVQQELSDILTAAQIVRQESIAKTRLKKASPKKKAPPKKPASSSSSASSSASDSDSGSESGSSSGSSIVFLGKRKRSPGRSGDSPASKRGRK